MKKSFTKFMSLLLVISTIMCLGITGVFAAGEDLTDKLTEAQLEYIEANPGSFSKVLSDDAATYSANDYIVTSAGPYYLIKDGDIAGVGDLATYYMEAQASAEMNSDKLNDITTGLRITANTEAAVETLSGLSEGINTILGLICVIITLLMSVYTAFDVCYIAFPAFRGKCDEAKASGQAGGLTKRASNGDTKLRYVTDDAQQAVSQAETEGGGSAWSIYLKSRIVAYVFLAIVLFMFMTGNINILTNIALKAVSGLMNILADLQI